MLGPRRIVGLAVAAVVSVAFVPGAAGDTREERDEVRRREAAAAADLDVLAVQDSEIAAALDTLAANLVAEQAALDTARREEVRAAAALAHARAVERATERDIARTEEAVRILAVQAYVGNSATPPLSFLLDSDDPLEVSQRSTLADTVTADLDDALEQLEVLRQRLARTRRERQAVADRAETLRVEVQDRVEALELARAQHEALAVEVAARIEARLSEAAALATLDAALSERITAEEIELGRRVAAFASTGTSAPAGEPPPLRTVQGFTVHAEIADAVEALVLAAADDGIELGGGGYRDAGAQWALRVAHCPDPVNSPASACSPPTAHVGASNHERGLAIDFTYEGAVIGSHDNPGFEWLEANAARFGFFNLPSEPWHWSVDGS